MWKKLEKLRIYHRGMFMPQTHGPRMQNALQYLSSLPLAKKERAHAVTATLLMTLIIVLSHLLSCKVTSCTGTLQWLEVTPKNRRK